MHLDVTKDREIGHTEHFSRARGSDNVLAARRYEPRPNFTPEHFQTNPESVIKHRCRGNVPVAARQQCGRGLNGILPHQEAVRYSPSWISQPDPFHCFLPESLTGCSVLNKWSFFLYWIDKSESTMTFLSPVHLYWDLRCPYSWKLSHRKY